ncbi:MAG: hypothetical protein ACEQSK_01555 [Sphingomonadaceae bacterium]
MAEVPIALLLFAGVALLVCALPAARWQQAYSPIVRDGPAGWPSMARGWSSWRRCCWRRWR